MPKIVGAAQLLFVLFKAVVALMVYCWALNVSSVVWGFGWYELLVALMGGVWSVGIYVGYNVKPNENPYH